MTTALPRGIRNNNPGNIDWSAANNWVGQKGKEEGPNGRFAVFTDAKYGIRALGKLLQTYYNKKGLVTVREIITRWAPATENNTDAYVKAVASRCGLGADEKIPNIKDPVVLGGLMKAIIKHENANYEYPESVFVQGLNLAIAA